MKKEKKKRMKLFSAAFYMKYPKLSKLAGIFLYSRWFVHFKRKLMLWKLGRSVRWGNRRQNTEWFHRPELFEKNLSEVGDLHMQWFFDTYCALRLKKNVSEIFDRMYKLMEERGNYSRKNAFGEMAGDCYLWIEKCDHSKVIIYEGQSFQTMYIKSGLWDKHPGDTIFEEFHIRALAYQWNYPPSRKVELKELTLKRYREGNFKAQKTQHCSDHDGLFFTDARDKGYLGSLRLGRMERSDQRCLWAINTMIYWEHYLDHPEDLSP